MQYGIDFINADTDELVLELILDSIEERDNLMNIWDTDGDDDRFPELGESSIRTESWSRESSPLDQELSGLLSIWTKG